MVSTGPGETKGRQECRDHQMNFDWLDPDGTKLVQEARVMTFRAAPKLRMNRTWISR